jgi:molybdopterin-guanine dinucleotide biosynthesis protein A
MGRLTLPRLASPAGWAAIVLAGGQSRRMGRDKALLELNGEPLLRRVVRRLAEVTNEIVVVGSMEYAPLVEGLNATVVPDRWPGRGPLGGLGTGLAAVASPVALVVGCDMPALAPALLLLLADACADHDAAFPRLGDRLEPLPAACRTSILPAIERLLAGTDDPPLQGIASAVRTRYVEESAIRLADPEYTG